jgi:ATP-dependent helicase/nuclease subunit A
MPTAVDITAWRPTEAQRRAIEAIDRSMAVDAAAGSGKTSVLIHRILRIVGVREGSARDADWSRLEQILAITFTEKAAGELRARLRPHVPLAERYRLERASVGTFHAFCAQVVRSHAAHAEVIPAFSILSEHSAGLEARKAVRETLLSLLEENDPAAHALCDAVDFRHAAGALEELMDFRWHAAHALAPRGEVEAKVEAEELRALGAVFERIRARYRERMLRAGQLDFQELEIAALALLAKQAIARTLRARFAHLLVDEFQDVNDVQMELVRRLYDPAQHRLFIVGDEAQSIYRFRGANVSCFAEARKAIAQGGGDCLKLSENFRARPGLIAFANRCQRLLADGLFSDATALRPMVAARDADAHAGPAVVELAIESPADATALARRAAEADAIAQYVGEQLAAGKLRGGSVACLFRALTSVDPYEAAFRRHGIPCRLAGGRGLLDRQEIVDLMAVLSWAAHPDDTLALLTLLRSPLVGLSDDDLAILAGPDGRALAAGAAADPRCQLAAELTEMGRHLRPSEILRRVLASSGYETICDRLDPSGAATANIDRFLAVAAGIEREVPTTLSDFTAFIAELRIRGARLGDPPAGAAADDAVRCMTVHAAKGLEFPIVILPDLFHRPASHSSRWIFTRGGAKGAAGIAFKRKDPEHPFASPEATPRFTELLERERLEEELESKRLLYVAMTRAREQLCLPIHAAIDREGPWHRWLRSILAEAHGDRDASVARWRPHGKARPPQEPKALPVRAAPKPKPPRCEGMALTVSQLESYDRCPLQYRLKYLLGLPSGELAGGDPEWLEANVFGTVVHGALAAAIAEPHELHEILRAQCCACGLFPEEGNLRHAAKQVQRAIDLGGRERLAEGHREFPFEWRVEGRTVVGSIDWLRPAAGGLEVVDFKTGDLKAQRVPERAEAYSLQLIAYALAAEAATGTPVLATTLIFPGPGEVVAEEVDARRRREGMARIRAILAGIDAGDMAVREHPPCPTCPYHHNALCWEDRASRPHKRSRQRSRNSVE